jgi:hypothetical protein
LNGKHPESARRLATYAAQVAATLDACDDAALLRPAWRFPAPLEQDSMT